MTSLNAPGFSISLLDAAGIRNSLSTNQAELTEIDLYDLLDASTDATAWIGARQWQYASSIKDQGREDMKKIFESTPAAQKTSSHEAHVSGIGGQASSASVIETAIRGACRSVLRIQSELTEFDTIVGDGDCGDTFASGANGRHLIFPRDLLAHL